jgi:hypothetical protein
VDDVHHSGVRQDSLLLFRVMPSAVSIAALVMPAAAEERVVPYVTSAMC